MDNLITESGMDFIADNTFHIEKSASYRHLGDGVRSVEFVRVKDDELVFIETKTTFPNPDNPNVENPARFKGEAEVICDKFIHSLNLFSSVKVGVAEEGFGNDFTMPAKVSLVLVLVIKNHKIEWCKPIETKLTEILPSFIKKIWEPRVFVINHETAAKYCLTTGPVDGDKATSFDIRSGN